MEQTVECLQHGCQIPQTVEIMNILEFYMQNIVISLKI